MDTGERIRSFFAKWRPILGLEEWDVSLTFDPGEFVMADGEPSRGAIASTSVSWEYRHADIHWNSHLAALEDDEALERIVVHEAMHILLNGLRPVVDRDADGVGKHYRMMFEEHTCTTLSWAFMRAIAS